MHSTALRLVVFSSFYLAIFSWTVPSSNPWAVPNSNPNANPWAVPSDATEASNWADAKEGERENLECTTLGCIDCHSWCPKVKHLCSSLKAYCRKSCDFCSAESTACKEANCDQRCIQSADGATATCTCFENFVMDEASGKCIDVDECSMGNALCSDPAKPYCFNHPGHYTCSKCDPKKEQYSYYERDECCEISKTETCGLGGATTGRIIGGEDSKLGAWPWQAYLHYPQALCGGTLISDRWVLTAAHCLSKGYPTSVMLGADNVTDSTNAHVQTFNVIEAVIHPDYSYPYHDIALIKLDRAPTQSQIISPACLPGGEVPPEGTKCFVTGFGTLERGGAVASHLQEVDVPIASSKKCKENYAAADVDIDEENMLCAGYDQGMKDACQGDSGGPLVCQRCDSCNWYVAGIVSFGKGCAQAKYYGVYTNVVKYENWISSITHEKYPKHEDCDDTASSWSAWGQWSECTVTCGIGGVRTRTRTCSGLIGDCRGPYEEIESCYDDVECPQPQWSEWSTCSVTCGGGTRERTRSCPEVEVVNCKISQSEVCNVQSCPQTYVWGEWESSGKCSELCDGGQITFTRKCLSDGMECVGASERYEDCNTFPCAEWGEAVYGECTTTCGDGIQMGIRVCTVVEGSSATCDGDANVVQTCNDGLCTGETTDWSACSVSCGGGIQTRLIDGVIIERECNNQPCPSWSDWSNWSACSVTCAGGTRTRERYCNNGRPGDDGCTGETQETESCNNIMCPAWGPWSDFGACSVSCGGGLQLATRVCIGGNVGDIGCEGSNEEFRACNEQPCPVWGEWKVAGLCSVTCGSGGLIKMSRDCINGNVGDAGCEGEDTKYVTCASDVPCPYWSDWSAYSACSVTCGPGTQTRTRTCVDETVVGGCPGSNTESQDCNDGDCGGVPSACDVYTDHADVACYTYAFTYDFCAVYYSYMQTYCKKSCCEKNNPTCVDTAGPTTCAQYSMFCAYPQVKEQCQKTCGLC